MTAIISIYGAFSQLFDADGEPGVVSIHPEMYPTKEGIAPSGRYHIFNVHPRSGTCIFIIQKLQSGNWVSRMRPHIITQQYIEWLGTLIENYPDNDPQLI